MNKYPKIGVGVIIKKEQKVLLLKRKNVHGAGSWSPPGGHLDYGEKPEECAIREVKEETNLDICNMKFQAITNDIFEKEGKHYVTIWMEGEFLSGEPIVNAEYEMSEIEWFSWDKLPEELFLSFSLVYS